MDNSQNSNYSQSGNLQNTPKNTENENTGPNENLLQHDDRNNIEPDSRANNNTNSEDYDDASNPLYNPDKDFEEDSDMDDAFLDEEENDEEE